MMGKVKFNQAKKLSISKKSFEFMEKLSAISKLNL